MKHLIDDSIELLRSIVQVPSLSFEEGKVCNLISTFLSSCSIEHTRVGNNIYAFNSHFNPKLETIALDAHIDTVPAAADYTLNPFDPGCCDDKVFGLGSNDDGGSVVSMIAVFRHFYDKELPVNLALVLTCEEERSGKGGAALLYSDAGPEQFSSIKWVVIGEPTGMKAAVSERGLLVIDGLSEGVSGHAARNEGVSALYIALDDIASIRSHKFSRISPTMGEVRVNVTQIEAGTAHNVIPDRCSFVVDIRPTDSYSNAEILAELQSLCKSTLTARNLTNRSSATPENSLLMKCADALGIERYSSPTTSDWMRIGGREGIKMGPGDSSRSHRADEFITRGEIENAVSTYKEFLEAFYGNVME